MSDDNDRLLPLRPQPTDGNPEELVKQIERRPRATPFQHGQLLSQHEVSKMRSRRLRKMRRSDPNASQSTLSIIGVITEFWQSAVGYVIGFKDGQSFGEAQVGIKPTNESERSLRDTHRAMRTISSIDKFAAL